MKQGDFRDQAVWKKARHLALTLSRATETFPQDARSRRLAHSIQRAFVDLLVWIPRALESGVYCRHAEHSLQDLHRAVTEAGESSLLKQEEVGHLRREMKSVSDALDSLRSAGGSSGGIDTHPRILHSFSTGVLYD